MDYKLLLWMPFLVASVTTTKVDLTSEWKQNFGWVITCSWKLLPNDTLLSVRLYEDDRQFVVYKPKNNSREHSQVSHRPGNMMMVHCSESTPKGPVGSCVVSLELHEPQTNNFTYSCEVSGERPKFLEDGKTIVINAFVPASNAVIEAGSINEESKRVMVNCTSSGQPAPRLEWTIGEQKVPADFTGTIWNVTSKLWHVWSAVSYTHSSEHTAACTPEIDWAGETMTGIPATYNSADVVKGK